MESFKLRKADLLLLAAALVFGAVLAAVLLPCVALGIWLGARWFRHVDEARFRRVVLALLLLMALAGLAPAVLKLAG